MGLSGRAGGSDPDGIGAVEPRAEREGLPDPSVLAGAGDEHPTPFHGGAVLIEAERVGGCGVGHGRLQGEAAVTVRQ